MVNSEVSTVGAKQHDGEVQSAMEARNINVWFNKHHVLQDINLNFPEKTVTALIGPSGC